MGCGLCLALGWLAGWLACRTLRRVRRAACLLACFASLRSYSAPTFVTLSFVRRWSAAGFAGPQTFRSLPWLLWLPCRLADLLAGWMRNEGLSATCCLSHSTVQLCSVQSAARQGMARRGAARYAGEHVTTVESEVCANAGAAQLPGDNSRLESGETISWPAARLLRRRARWLAGWLAGKFHRLSPSSFGCLIDQQQSGWLADRLSPETVNRLV